MAIVARVGARQKERIDVRLEGVFALEEKSDKNRGETVDEGGAEIALSYISQLFDNAGDTEPGGAR